MKKSELSTSLSFSTHFSEDGLEFCILQIEDAIIKSKTLLSEKLPSFKETEEIYLSERKEIYEIEQEIEKKTEWLNGLVANRGKNLGKTDIRILRTTSHTEDKHKKEIINRVNWMIPAGEILEREKRFLNPEILYEMILKSYPHLAKKVATGYSIGIKVRVISNFIRAATLDRKTGTKLIAIYQNKIGLYKWMVKDKPLATFMKDFLFQPQQL